MIDYFKSTVGNDRTIRVTHGGDPVPMFSLGTNDYVQPALEIYYPYESDGEYIVCDGSGKDPNCIVSYSSLLNVDDHFDYLGVEMSCTTAEYESREAEWRIVANMSIDDLNDYRSKLVQKSETSNKNNDRNYNHATTTIIIVVAIVGVVLLCLTFGWYWKYKRAHDDMVTVSSMSNRENRQQGDYVPPQPETQLTVV